MYYGHIGMRKGNITRNGEVILFPVLVFTFIIILICPFDILS